MLMSNSENKNKNTPVFGDNVLCSPAATEKPKIGYSMLPKMDDAQFTLWSNLLEKKTGMRLLDNRKSFLVTNLGMRMQKLGYTQYQDYYNHICSGRNGTVEWDNLIHHLTVHETRFFRHKATLDLIRETCLPQKAAVEGARKPVTINIWSVGCSTGEEPYSVAMSIDDYLTQHGYESYLGIIASDISRSALATGRDGKYPLRHLSEIEPRWLEKYFTVTSDGMYQIVPELRQRVCFNQLNVLDIGQKPFGNMDVIICQNVLIYYDRERRLQIANNLAEFLTPGGLFIFAGGEMLNWPNKDMERFPYPNTLAYRRKT